MAGQSNKKPTENVDEIVAKLLEEAKAEAARIIEDAKAEARNISAPAKTDKKLTKDQEEAIARGEELVDVRLPRVKDEGSKFVAVNGDNVLIPRGVPVKIKRKFYEVLMAAEEQNDLAMRLMEGLADEFETDVAKNL